MACTISTINLLDEQAINSLKNQIKAHPSWKDNLSCKEIESILLETPYYTYILSPNDQEGFYRLSFLERDHKVHHHSITILQREDGIWGFKNGVLIIFENISELIPYSIGCTEGACQPYVNP